jgi:hypothetical protein
MEFATPGLLWWLLAVPLVLLFGLWRTRPVAVTVPSLRLWDRLKERNPPLRELRRPALQVSLVLQALAAALLVAALAGPQRSESRPGPRAVFILLDDSASLGARDAQGRVRWDLARDAVRSIAERAAPNDRLVVASGHVLAGGATGGRYDGAPGGVAAFLRDLRPFDCGEETVARAARLLAAECGTAPGRSLVVVSDRRAPWLAEAVKAAAGRLVTVGGPVQNAGIVALSGEATASGGCDLFLGVAGPPGTAVEVELAVSDDGSAWRELGSVRVDLDLQGGGSLVHRVGPPAPGSVLRARLTVPDGLAADDAAFAVRAADGPDVVCFTARPGNLVRAMQSIPGLTVEVRPADSGRPAPVRPGPRLAVYEGVVPERLPEGQWVVLADPPASAGPFEVGEAGPAAADAWRVAPPLTDHVDLPSVAVRRARSCRLREPETGSVRSILESRDRGTLLAWWDRPGGGVVYAGFDLSWRGDPGSSATSWALDPSFPIFWSNVAEAARSGAATGGSWTAGRTCEPLVLPGRAEGIREPAGIVVQPGPDGRGPWRVMSHRPGLVIGEGPGGPRALGAIGLFDAVETACESGGGEGVEAWRLPDPPDGSQVGSFTGAFAVGAGLLLLAGWLLAARAG